MQIYVDGHLVPEEDATVSVFDHGLLYGDGIFEGIRFYSGRVFKLEEHISRLYDSAKAILLDIPISATEMLEAVLTTVRANQLSDGYVRLVVTRGKGSLGLSPKSCPNPSVIIIAANIALYPEEKYSTGLKLITCPTRRPTPASLSPMVKSLNYLNNVMAKIEAQASGADEGLMLNEQGYVTECTGDNLFIIKNGKAFTPHVSAGMLQGITRDTAIEILTELGVAVSQETLTRYDIFTADECFLTGTAAEVIPAVELDQRRIGAGEPGPITRRCVERYREIVNSQGTSI
jgi:branched-chain amino acid aminotransferase